MILAVDIGNSNIIIGCIDDSRIYFEEKISTVKSKTSLEYVIAFKTVLELYGIEGPAIEGSIISSVVPSITSVVKSAVEKIIGKSPLVVGPGIKTGLNLQMDNPKTVGSDLIVDAVAGIAEYGAPLIIVDMGTATTLSVVDEKKNYIGGVIMSGIELSMNALSTNAAQLVNVGLEVPKYAIGKNTVDSLKSGMIFGNAASIDGMIDRIEKELGYQTTVIATGAQADVVIPLCSHDITVDEHLLLKGLKIIYDKNA